MKRIVIFITLLSLLLTNIFSVFADYRDPKYLQCNKNNRPFTIIYPPEFIEDDASGEGYGRFIFSGEIVKEEGLKPFTDNEKVDYIRMKVKNDGSLAYRYFLMLAKSGNAINIARDKVLYFNIGTFENGKLKSSAKIKSKAKKRILKSLEDGQTISLKMTVPLYEGMGAPAHFTYACRIH